MQEEIITFRDGTTMTKSEFYAMVEESGRRAKQMNDEDMDRMIAVAHKFAVKNQAAKTDRQPISSRGTTGITTTSVSRNRRC